MTKPNVYLIPSQRAAVAFDAIVDHWQFSTKDIAEFLAPSQDSNLVCQHRMVKWLQYNIDNGSISGVFFPEDSLSGLAYLKERCRYLSFHSCDV